MNTKEILDETFNRFLGKVQSGLWLKRSDIKDYSLKELDDLLWEIEEEYGRMPTYEEQKKCLKEAVSYRQEEEKYEDSNIFI